MASRIAVAERVRPGSGVFARGSSSGTIGFRDVMPAAAMRASQYTGAPSSSAARPFSSAASSSTRLSPNDRSAAAWITRSATARESGGRWLRSMRDRRMR